MQPEHEREYSDYVAHRLESLRRAAFLLCQDWHRADDVVQNAVTKLYVHWKRVRAADNLDAYAHTVLVREFLAERRGSWASRVFLTAHLRPALVEPPDHAGRISVRQALAKVPPRQRAVLVLRFYCDMSVEEAARVLGCSTGTVKSQTARGLEALRRVLDATPSAAIVNQP